MNKLASSIFIVALVLAGFLTAVEKVTGKTIPPRPGSHRAAVHRGMYSDDGSMHSGGSMYSTGADWNLTSEVLGSSGDWTFSNNASNWNLTSDILH